MPKRSLTILATKPLGNDPGWVAMEPGELVRAQKWGARFFKRKSWNPMTLQIGVGVPRRKPLAHRGIGV